jgi:fucose permease
VGYYAYLMMGWNAVLVPTLIRPIEQAFHRADAAFGLVYLVSSLAYACGALGSGVLTERVGRRPMFVGGALLLGAGLAGEAMMPSWTGFVLLAIPVGWGAGLIEAGMTALLLALYRDTQGRALSLLHFFYSVGAFVAPFAVGLIVTAGTTWRMVLLLTAAGVVSLLAVLARAPMPPGRRPAARSRPAGTVTRTAPAAVDGSLLPFAGLAVSIGCYLAVEIGISAWVVRFFVGLPLAAATGILSGFWAGLMVGRLLSNRMADRVNEVAFTVGCLITASLTLLAAAIVPWVPVSAALFAVAGLCYGPIYPLIMAIGGRIYPHRLATVSGGLASAAIVGSVIYPPLMGVLSARIGLSGALIGGAILGIPAALGLVGASWLARRGDAGVSVVRDKAA